MISELPASHVSARGGRRSCDDYPTIDIRHPRHRELVDRPGRSISWRWNRDSKPLRYVDMVFHRDHVMLTDVTDRTRQRSLSISLLRTLCHYGGTRPWFKCPACGGRCAKLYFRDDTFRC